MDSSTVTTCQCYITCVISTSRHVHIQYPMYVHIILSSLMALPTTLHVTTMATATTSVAAIDTPV